MTRPPHRRGQSTTEYFLVVSVIVIGLVAAAYAFLPGFRSGVQGLDRDVGLVLSSGTRDGSGGRR